MSNDRRLVAVNVLVEYCESQFAANISMQNESNLDVLQLSNLHKMEMFMHAFEIGNNLDVFENIKAEEPTDPELQQQEYSQKVTAEQEDCVTTPLKMEEKVVSKISEEIEDFHEELKGTSFNKDYSKGYKWTGEKIDDFRKGYNNKFDELFDGALKKGLDIEDCFNCKKPTSGETKLPAFEIAWELKQFLKNLKNLLKDIRMSLDDTKIISDLCNLKDLMSKNKSLCPSSWPLVAASFPIIINRARAQLMELGVSWTGIIGPIISPILNGLTYTAETFRNMATPIFDCILNAFRTMRIGMQALEMAGTSLVDQAKLVGKAWEGFTSEPNVRNIQEQVNIAEITKRRLKAVEQSSKQPSVTSSTIPEMKVIPDQTPYAENLVSGYNPYSYERAGLDLPSSPVVEEIATTPVVKQTNLSQPLGVEAAELSSSVNSTDAPSPVVTQGSGASHSTLVKAPQTSDIVNDSGMTEDEYLPEIDYSAELSKLIYVDLYLQPFIASGEDKGEPFRASIVMQRNEDFNKEETVTLIKKLATEYYAKNINPKIVGCGVFRRVLFYEALGRRNGDGIIFVIGGGGSAYRSKDDYNAVFKLQKENRDLVQRYKDIYPTQKRHFEIYYKLGTRSFDDVKIVVANAEEHHYSGEHDFFTLSEMSKQLRYPEMSEAKVETLHGKALIPENHPVFEHEFAVPFWPKYVEGDPYNTRYANNFSFRSLEEVKHYLKTGEVVKKFEPLTNNLEREAMALKTQSAEVKALAKPKYTSEVALGGRLQRQPAFLYNQNINIPAVKSGGYVASGANPELTRFNAISNIFRTLENGVLKAKLSVEEFFNRLIYTFKSFSRLILEPLYTSSQLISEIKVAFNMIRLVRLVMDLIEKGLSVCDSLEDSNAKKLLENLVKEEFEDVEVEFDSDSSEKTIAVVKSKSSNYQSRLVPNDCGEVLVKVNDKQVDLDLIYDKIVNELG